LTFLAERFTLDEMEEDQGWHKLLTEGHRPLWATRRVMRLLPSPPRCKVCHNPFAGIGGRLVARAGFRRSRKNPNLCSRCCDSLPPGGAEVDIAVLFADVRSSTSLGEHASPQEFARTLNRFYAVTTERLVRHDAVIDKLIGDEVMALFVRGMAGPDYRRRAVDAAIDLMRGLGYGSRDGPWLDVGAAVAAGVAYVGNVGPQSLMDFTALGDPVNLAARLQSGARAGEVVVAADVDEGLEARFPTAPLRTVTVRGRQAPVKVRIAAPWAQTVH
jgi:adenylate cyclase